MSVLSAAVLLFLVIDPLGNIPMFLVALRGVAPARQRVVLVRELLIALGVLLVFLFFGHALLRVFHISEPSLSIAGGVVLFLIALRMIFPQVEGAAAAPAEPEPEPLIVPLAVPYLAGPSAVATVMLMVTREPQRWLDWLLATLLAWFAAAVILYWGAALCRLLGERGLTAIERLMGMLLTAVAVQMTMNGVRAFLAEAA
jgi:multiple antibiotic resistance protein